MTLLGGIMPGPTGRIRLSRREALRRQGYAILATRYRTRVGEIDIVAQDGAADVEPAVVGSV